MLRNDVSLPPLPLADMSTTEIEYTTLAPTKFSRMVKQRRARIVDKREGKQDPPIVPKMRPATHRTVHIDVEEELNAVRRPSIISIPGGRYIIITTHEVIHVVDLGSRYDSLTPERPITRPACRLVLHRWT